MSDDEETALPIISIDSLKSASYEPSTGRLILDFPYPMSGVVGMSMDVSIHLEAMATETLLNAIRHVEKSLGGPIEVPKTKRSA